MKKILIGTTMMLWIFPAMAQTAAKPASRPKTHVVSTTKRSLTTPEQRALPYTNELKKTLELTDGQYQKMLAVNTECIRKKDALKATGQYTAKGDKEITEYRKQQYNMILTPAQQVKLKAMNERMAGPKQENPAPVTDGSISD